MLKRSSISKGYTYGTGGWDIKKLAKGDIKYWIKWVDSQKKGGEKIGDIVNKMTQIIQKMDAYEEAPDPTLKSGIKCPSCQAVETKKHIDDLHGTGMFDKLKKAKYEKSKAKS